jgi:hypothetical protein
MVTLVGAANTLPSLLKANKPAVRNVEIEYEVIIIVDLADVISSEQNKALSLEGSFYMRKTVESMWASILTEKLGTLGKRTAVEPDTKSHSLSVAVSRREITRRCVRVQLTEVCQQKNQGRTPELVNATSGSS